MNKSKKFFKPLCAALAFFLAVADPVFAYPQIKRIEKSSSACGTYALSERGKNVQYRVSTAYTKGNGQRFYNISVCGRSIARNVPESQVESSMVSHFSSQFAGASNRRGAMPDRREARFDDYDSYSDSESEEEKMARLIAAQELRARKEQARRERIESEKAERERAERKRAEKEHEEQQVRDLHDAVSRGAYDEFCQLLKSGANPNSIDERDGLTVLHKAVIYRNIDMVRTLLEAGADPNCTDKKGETALHKLTRTYSEGEEGRDAKVRKTIEIMDLLIDKGAKVNCKDHSGYTPKKRCVYPEVKAHLKERGCSRTGSATKVLKTGAVVAIAPFYLGWKFLEAILG